MFPSLPEHQGVLPFNRSFGTYNGPSIHHCRTPTGLPSHTFSPSPLLDSHLSHCASRLLRLRSLSLLVPCKRICPSDLLDCRLALRQTPSNMQLLNWLHTFIVLGAIQIRPVQIL